MRILVLFNPISGGGRAERAASEISRELRAACHEVTTATTQPKPASEWLDPQLAGVELLVVAGGDGAMRLASAAAVRTGTPVYHLPLGTENLFAREFGMDRRVSTLLNAIATHDIRTVDVALANGEQFLLMASVGLDAEVVHDLASCRGASISHSSYLAPIWRQLRLWRPCCLEITVDGRRIDNGGAGFVVVVNCRQYGWRLNPASSASMFDQLLDVVYFPARSRMQLLHWAARCRFNRHVGTKGLAYERGRHVQVRSQAFCRYQLDGDPAGPAKCSTPTMPLGLDIRLVPSALRVLVPAAAEK